MADVREARTKEKSAIPVGMTEKREERSPQGLKPESE